MNESYTASLYETVLDRDQKAMTDSYREFFNSEVERGGFTRHQKSFFVMGPKAYDDCLASFACLMRGKYATVMVDPVTIVRRLDSKWIPRWTAEDDVLLENAETIIIPDMFDADVVADMAHGQKGDLVWFVKDAIRNGVVIVAPTVTDADLDILGESFGAFIEQNFEVVKNAKQARSKSQHGGNETAGKRNPKGKRKNTPRD